VNGILYFDGCCEEVNPGGTGAWGWLLVGETARLSSGMGSTPAGPGSTNNVAEYHALGFGLKDVIEAIASVERFGRLTVRGDSQLVIYQMTGKWACRKEHLIKLRDRCRELAKEIEGRGVKIDYEWVPREQNAEADALSQRAWEQATGRKFPQRRRN
jgi:ribonuclease HI